MHRKPTDSLTFFRNKTFSISIITLCVFALCIFAATDSIYAFIETSSLWVRNHFGRYYLYLGLFCVVFITVIALLPIGKKRLGKESDKPEYSRWAWIAMLYSAGMGAGILLRAVQEPVYMFINPPINTSASAETIALEYTFYQWGFTAWAFYGLFGLILAYYLYNKQRPVLLSSSISSFVSNAYVLRVLDVLVILTTIFGLVGAVGLGATQISGGLNHLLPYSFSLKSTLLIVALISFLACVSVWKGVDKGIKIISTGNILATLVLLFIVVLHGDVWAILSRFVTTTGRYILDFIPLSLSLGKYNPGEEFLSDWTYYYWAFWLAWAPFTGVFIARISKGRTIRELLIGVMLIPSLGTFFWFTAFGEGAFSMLAEWGTYEGEFGNVFTSIFVYFNEFPLQCVINTMVVLLLISFLVTSVDSAVFVLSMFTDSGKLNPSKKMRLIWSVVVAVFTFAIVILGNATPDIDVLVALQKLLIVTSLPFALLIPILCYFFVRDLRKP